MADERELRIEIETLDLGGHISPADVSIDDTLAILSAIADAVRAAGGGVIDASLVRVDQKCRHDVVLARGASVRATEDVLLRTENHDFRGAREIHDAAYRVFRIARDRRWSVRAKKDDWPVRGDVVISADVPIDEPPPEVRRTVQGTTTLYGVVVGIYGQKEKVTVDIKLPEGGRTISCTAPRSLVQDLRAHLLESDILGVRCLATWFMDTWEIKTAELHGPVRVVPKGPIDDAMRRLADAFGDTLTPKIADDIRRESREE